MLEPAYTETIRQGSLQLRLSGDWRMAGSIPEFRAAPPGNGRAYSRLSLVDAGIESWDSMLMVFVMRCHRFCREHGLKLDVSAMPPAIARLLKLATGMETGEPSAAGPASGASRGFRPGLGRLWMILPGIRDFLEFVGYFGRSLVRFMSGRATVRGRDIVYFIEQVGPKALGIITLTSILVGMILGYLGSVQLRQFGAGIYVADLVAVGMTREMGALMTAVILAGRTGAAYAAQLGTMQVNEELNALKTLGLSSMEFLVLPRMLALLLIMPLLCIYADILGMFGGAIVATSLDVNWNLYIAQTQSAIGPVDFITGLVKSVFFALFIGIAGCQAGLKCGRDANAVGLATTAAVVTALVYLIVVDAMFNILFDQLGL